MASFPDEKAIQPSTTTVLGVPQYTNFDASPAQSFSTDPSDPNPRQKWYQYFSPTDTPEERRLILKLDVLIMIVVLLAYWVKVLDSSATSTAYVSGMEEDLGLYGNELNYLNTVYIRAYSPENVRLRADPDQGRVYSDAGPFDNACTMDVSLKWVERLLTEEQMTRFPVNYFLPAADLLWGVFTLVQYVVPEVLDNSIDNGPLLMGRHGYCDNDSFETWIKTEIDDSSPPGCIVFAATIVKVCCRMWWREKC